jgi:hypothetical protein
VLRRSEAIYGKVTQDRNECEISRDSMKRHLSHQGAFLGGENGVAKRSQNVVGIFTVVVTRGRVVADGEGHGGAGVDVAELVAHHGRATDVGGALPDDLGEVAPLLELGHAGAGATVGGREVADFVVVHQVGDHHADLALLDAVADVLAVTTAINGARDDVSLDLMVRVLSGTYVSCW